MLILSSPMGDIQIADEPGYVFGSSVNDRIYRQEINLSCSATPYSVHGILFGGIPTIVVGADGGPTTVGAHSAIISSGRLYAAVGNQIICVDLSSGTVPWVLEGDMATCFGLHASPVHNALVCHGELAISRFSPDGTMLWSRMGRDIFSEGFGLCPDFIEARDFGNNVYRFRYNDGWTTCHSEGRHHADDPEDDRHDHA